MSPVYDPRPEEMSRFTVANLAFLGVNALIAAALVFGLWKGGRLIVPASSDASRDGTATARDGHGTDPSATGGPGTDRAQRTGTEPGTAVYYSSSADYQAAHPDAGSRET